ncbi:sigma-54 interaction domain-containing protein [Celerinatantimonas diazotrophica]|uniref:Sigma-54-specific transcriptional regulator n=1 Tax=Celerinatantimonas diazotrophica TaxID=412034 RepID=A0A4R1K4E6_9GAMM|nr:sigma-54 dependent transcriptional regulator [Celerinatantimonas diazotrophica]TCK59006.1 sigma-54-specific transcriptional regulator [Celerinatantimonas diazotrophica]CAG9297641.1 Anaerobic nitric oxide reductase transcription regulator NorR [Celerinatantimonas diazotrophica]
MKAWLSSAADLLTLRDSQQLIEHYVQFLTVQLAVQAVHLIVPDNDGRTLVCLTHAQDLSWAVDDFEHPFSHLIQKQEMRLIRSSELPYWTDNQPFTQLLEQKSRQSGILLSPCNRDGHRVQTIVTLVAEDERLEALLEDQQWREYTTIFIQQWDMLSELSQRNSQQYLLKQSIHRMQSEQRTQHLAQQLKDLLIGDSPAMVKLRKQTIRAAQSSLTVLVQGETGTGKELVARALHQYSPRRTQPFVTVNCAAIPEQLLESELFGHEKGAFSGAIKAKRGIIAEAHQGTLFLDEIGDMPLPLQAKLLRVLETHQFRAVGANESQHSDFRLVAATHVNLLEKVKAGEFRQDLYYRLCQYPLHLPALRERSDDLQALTYHFVRQFNQAHQLNVRSVHFQLFDKLATYSFPGNVRELRHLVEFGCTQVDDSNELNLNCFGDRLTELTEWMPTNVDEQSSDSNVDEPYAQIHDLKQALRQFEASIIRTRLEEYRGDRAKTAQSLGLPKRTLAHKCQKLEIES